MPRVQVVLLAVAGVLAASGCSSGPSFTVRGRPSPRGAVVPGTDSTVVGTAPGTTRVPSQPTAGRSSTLETRRVCRAGAWPTGWIAIAYESASTNECPAGAITDESHPVAVIAQYARLVVGQSLEVCADQVTPRGWRVVSGAEVSSEACPGAGKDGASATRVIRRVE